MPHQKLKAEQQQYPRAYLYKRIVQAKLFIDNNYADKIDMDDISGEAYCSKFHFIRLFKQTYGKTPHQYLTAVRINKAVLLLREEMPVADVCFLVGFESLSSFSGLFKKTIGMAPSLFMEQQKNRQSQISSQPMSFISGCFAAKFGWTGNSNFEEA